MPGEQSEEEQEKLRLMAESVNDNRILDAMINDEVRSDLLAKVKILKADGANNSQIAEQLSYPESVIRNLLRNDEIAGMRKLPHDLYTLNDPPFEDTSGYSENPNRFMQAALLYVVGANAVQTSETGAYELKVEDLYIVWWSYTLGNWKALISTNQPGDGLYFEVTHNETKEETYVDIYEKIANHVFSHHDH